MSNNPLKTYWMECSFFPVWIGFVPDAKEWARVTKEYGETIEYPGEKKAGRITAFEYKGRLVILMTIRHYKHEGINRNEISATIAHECVHIWQFIIRHIHHEFDGDEIEAYAIQYWMNEALIQYEKFYGWPKEKAGKK